MNTDNETEKKDSFHYNRIISHSRIIKSHMEDDPAKTEKNVLSILEQAKRENWPELYINITASTLLDDIFAETTYKIIKPYKNTFSYNYSDFITDEDIKKVTSSTDIDYLKKYFSGLLKKLESIKSNIEKKNRIYQIKKYIDKNYGNHQLTLIGIAENFGYHHAYLSALFKQTFQYTVSEYIKRTRIQKSRNLLEDTDLIIKDIALAVGYLDEKSFMKAFKKNQSVTPTQFRKLKKDFDYHK